MAGLFFGLIVRFFRWPAKFRAADADASIGTIKDVTTSAVNLVYMDRFRVEAMAEPVSFHRFDEGHPFVEVIPGEFLQVSETFYDADCQLGPELYVCPGLAPYNWPDVGLADTNDTVFDAVGFMVIHVFLLTVKFLDGHKFQSLTQGKWAFHVVFF